ncbi:hypothetical protein BC936DRAFT_147130 [Jimgerdemannia flammicorona]|uniref:Zn(2)-C6 fungal-type domain-containing protein n=1 Tax=Jimgerdemannia flammicorona TaxID=994334 RepID=A0A433D601_9FUNG|nr:hypothetical protein BC936DRAFT_147130 [Jimgerdemannia flammicorona]
MRRAQHNNGYVGHVPYLPSHLPATKDLTFPSQTTLLMEIRDTTYSFHRSKRNKPCDLCRRQRRKCVPGENRCIRCDQMHLDCTYEDVLSSSAEDGENAEEKARMLEEVSEIEQQMLVIKEEMNTVRVAAGLPGLYSFMELESVGSSDGYPHSPSNHSTKTDYNDDGSMPRTMILDGTPNLGENLPNHFQRHLTSTVLY